MEGTISIEYSVASLFGSNLMLGCTSGSMLVKWWARVCYVKYNATISCYDIEPQIIGCHDIIASYYMKSMFYTKI